MAMLLPRFFVFALILGACQGGQAPAKDGGPEQADAAPIVDGAPSADADPSCVQWRRVEQGIVDAELLDTTQVNEARSARFRVGVLRCPGDDPGIFTFGYTLENEFLLITSSVWRAGPDCETPDVVERDIAVQLGYAATWSIVVDSWTQPLVVDVDSAPSGQCGDDPPSACQRDCDCEQGEACLSAANGTQRCARPCELDRDCAGDVCGDANGLENICLTGTAECEPPTRPCPDGFVCHLGTCEPDFVLSGSTRHGCSCDSDCAEPLRCVLGASSTDSPGRCEMVCPSASNGWCEGPHSCLPGWSIESTAGICGWVGD